MEGTHNKKVPHISKVDRELLKLINSDLWEFVKSDAMDGKIGEIVQINDQSDRDKDTLLYQKIREIKNLSNPRGQKLTLYEQ